MKHFILLAALFLSACSSGPSAGEQQLEEEKPTRTERGSAGNISFQQKFDKDLAGRDSKHLFRAPPVVPVGGIFLQGGNCLFPFSAEEISDPSSLNYCGARATVEDCSKDNFCIWLTTCSELTDANSCDARDDCAFGPGNKCAPAKCPDIKIQSKCDHRVDCQWTQNSCQNVGCNAIKEASWCASRPDCDPHFDSAGNVTCQNKPNYTPPDTSKTACHAPVDVQYQCPAQTQCVGKLPPALSQTPNPYETCYSCAPLQSVCNDTIDCPCKDLPEKKKCSQFSSGNVCALLQSQCHDIDNKTQCIKGNPYCEWKEGAKPFCQARSDTDASNAPGVIKLCKWVPETPPKFDPACEKRTGQCFRANLVAGKTACDQTNGFCTWNASNNTCELTGCDKSAAACGMYKEACEEVGLCSWDGRNCQPKPLHRDSADLETCANGAAQITPRPATEQDVSDFLDLVDGFANAFKKPELRCLLIGSEGGERACNASTFHCEGLPKDKCELGVNLGCIYENNQCIQVARCHWAGDRRCRLNADQTYQEKRRVRLKAIRQMLYDKLMDASARDCGGRTDEGVVTIGTLCPLIAPCGQAMISMRAFSCKDYDCPENETDCSEYAENCDIAKNRSDKPVCKYDEPSKHCLPHPDTAKEICESFKDSSDDANRLCDWKPDNNSPWAEAYKTACKPRPAARQRCSDDTKCCFTGPNCPAQNETLCQATQAAIDTCEKQIGCDYNSATGECSNIIAAAISKLNQALDYIPVGLGFWCHGDPVTTAKSGSDIWPDLPFCPAHACRYQDDQAMRCGVCEPGRGDSDGWCS